MKNYIIGVAGIIAVLLIVLLGGSSDTTFGSVTVGNDYQTYEATSTMSGAKIVKAGSGSFGSLIVASSTTAGTFGIYDNALATSTATSTRIAVFQPGLAGGTYTFDREILLGIVLDIGPGFNGDYVVTYR